MLKCNDVSTTSKCSKGSFDCCWLFNDPEGFIGSLMPVVGAFG